MDTPFVPTIYKRKYADSAEVSHKDLLTAYRVAAQMVADHGDKYLPLFERLDNELQALKKKDRILNRALDVALNGTNHFGRMNHG